MADELEKLLGTLLGYGIIAAIVCALAVVVAPFAIAFGVIWLVVKIVQAANRASQAKQDFLREVEPPLKSMEDEVARQNKRLNDAEWNGRLSKMEKALACAGA